MLTLEYDGVEKDLAAWGIDMESVECNFANLSADVFSVTVPVADMTADPLFAFEGAVIVRRGRTGSGTSWSGGTTGASTWSCTLHFAQCGCQDTSGTIITLRRPRCPWRRSGRR